MSSPIGVSLRAVWETALRAVPFSVCWADVNLVYERGAPPHVVVSARPWPGLEDWDHRIRGRIHPAVAAILPPNVVVAVQVLEAA